LYKTLDTSDAQAQNEGDRAQEARGPCTDQGRPFTDNAVREKKERFLVPFWRLPKRYPLAEGQRKLLIKRKRQRKKSLDSRARGNDDQEIKAGFQLD